MLEDLTICVKTFMRPHSLDKCLFSIRAKYPDVKILVANDAIEPIKNEKATIVFNLPFDVGLSAGRNFLLEKVATPYVMFIDDDTIFTQESNLQDMLEILKSNNIDLVAGKIRGNDFYGTLEIEDGVLYRNCKSYRSIEQGFKIYDYVLNLFIAKTDKVKQIKWNEDLKIVEHMDFFWRAKDHIKSTVCENAYFLNTSDRPPRYSDYRVKRINHFKKMQCNVIGVKDIRNRIK